MAHLNKLDMKMIGTLTLNGDKYAVLQERADVIHHPPEASFLKVSFKVPYFFIARSFVVDKETEGIHASERVYVYPHWASISGNFVVQWLQLPETVEVIMSENLDMSEDE